MSENERNFNFKIIPYFSTKRQHFKILFYEMFKTEDIVATSRTQHQQREHNKGVLRICLSSGNWAANVMLQTLSVSHLSQTAQAHGMSRNWERPAMLSGGVFPSERNTMQYSTLWCSGVQHTALYHSSVLNMPSLTNSLHVFGMDIAAHRN